MAKAKANVKKMSDSVGTWKTNSKAAAKKWKQNVKDTKASAAYNANVAESAGVGEGEVAAGAGASWKSFADGATEKQYKAGIDKEGAGERLVSGYAQGVVKKKS
jgi:hypothetical protein